MDEDKTILIADRYLMEKRYFDKGGMGTIHKAIDTTFGRVVAIKVIKESKAKDSSYRERFEREALIMGKLSHDNIITVYDFGVGDMVWLAMDMLEGSTFEELDRPMPLDDVVTLASQAASALQYAHGRNMVHCDIKPRNIFAEANKAVLIDWGIGYEHGVADGSKTARTKVRGPNGTPAYAAPEQTVGDPIKASDVYSLGVTLFELITGRLPFRAPHTVMLANQHLNDERPSLLSFRPDCYDWLDRLVRWMMEVDPKNRPTPEQILLAIKRKRVNATAIRTERESILIHHSVSIPFIAKSKLMRQYDVITEPYDGPVDFFMVAAEHVDESNNKDWKGMIVVLRPMMTAAEILSCSFIDSVPLSNVNVQSIEKAIHKLSNS